MSKVIDNLLKLNHEENVDKEYLNNVLSNAIAHFDPENIYQIKIGDMDKWKIDRWVSSVNHYDYVRHKKEKLGIYIPINRINEEQKSFDKNHITIRRFDNQYPYGSIYGLKKELKFMPDIDLDNQTFKNNYDDYRHSFKLRNQSLILDLGLNEIDQLKMSAKSNCKHLDFYLNQIFNTYIKIIKKFGLEYFICNRNERVHENSSPVLKKIIINSSSGIPFMGIRLNVTNDVRLVNQKFYNEHKITVKFDRIDKKQVERNSAMFNRGNIPTNPLFHTCIAQKYNNRYTIDLLTEHVKPNYYFFMETSKGKIKLNKDIIQSCTEKMMLKYIFNPMFKDSGVEINSEEELSENFLSYFDMYQLMKY